MPRLTRIYTRTGDDGTTALGSGRRVSKDDARIEAYGTVDELNAAIGVALARGLDAEIDVVLLRVQNDLFHLGSDLCFPETDKTQTPVPKIDARHVEALERELDRWTAELPALENFILPGGTKGAADLHVARTIARRAERRVQTLARAETVGGHVLQYLNRLSDLLFVMSRIENARKGRDDVYWDSHA